MCLLFTVCVTSLYVPYVLLFYHYVCSAWFLDINLFLHVATIVKFSQLTYSTAENNGPLQAVLILNNTLSYNITLQITDNNDTAIGECPKTLAN